MALGGRVDPPDGCLLPGVKPTGGRTYEYTPWFIHRTLTAHGHRFVADLLNAEINEKRARSIKHQPTIAKRPLAKDLEVHPTRCPRALRNVVDLVNRLEIETRNGPQVVSPSI